MAGVWPLFIEAIFNRDLPVIQFYVLMSACIFILSSLIVDLVQLIIDPRISRKEGRQQ